MSVCLAQFFVATTERRSQLVLQLLKVPEFPLYIGELFLKAALDRCTGLQAIPSQFQQASNLAECESQPLHTTNKGNSFDVGVSISAETALRSRRTR